VDARAPQSAERLLGLEGWRRAALAAKHAGAPEVTLWARDAAQRVELEAAIAADQRLAGMRAMVDVEQGDALLLDGGGVYDPAGVRARSRGEDGGVALGSDVRQPARVRVLQRAAASSADGLVDTWFNRPVARAVTRAVTRTPITPNQITVLSFVVGLLGVAGIASLDWRLGVAGALLLQASAAIDCIDGELARLTYRFSPFGARLDLLLDNIVHLLLFAAMGWASVPLWGTAWALAAGGAMVAGGALSFGVVWFMTFTRPASPHSALARLLDKMTNRDFTVLVLAAAVAGRWDVLLAIMAVGVNVFWPLVLAVAIRERATRG
jgi:phosphatidylglycerophosphate synthase